MRFLLPTVGGIGISAGNVDAQFVAASAIPAGAVVEVDQGLSDSGSLNLLYENAASGICRVVAPSAGGARVARVHGILLQNAAPGRRVSVRLVGRAFMVVGGSVFAGGKIVVAGGSVAGKRVKGLVMEDAGVDGELGYVDVLWNGIFGFTTAMEGDVGGGEPPGGFPLDPIGIGPYQPSPPGWGLDVPLLETPFPESGFGWSVVVAR